MNTSVALGRMARRLSVVLGTASLVAGLGAAPALAKPNADSMQTGKTLTLTVAGRVTPRCEIDGGGDIDFGRLTGNRTATARFGLDCNVPFQLTFQSSRGGLAHETLAGGQGPFAGTLGYDVSVKVPTRTPEPVDIAGAFTSAELRGGRTLSSGSGVAAGGGLMTITTQRPTGAGLLAGDYSDSLRITIAPN